ncbi:MAG: hypothetical protein J0H64_00730, partial [Actinobacteria bacterium]|nr:hypothetical protein [Actinomycetota bacterium]
MNVRDRRHPAERNTMGNAPENSAVENAAEQSSNGVNESAAAADAGAATAETEAPRRRSRRASAAVGEAVEAPAAAAPAAVASGAEAPAADAAPEEAAPKKRATRSRKKAEPKDEAPVADVPVADADAPAAEAPAAPAKSSRGRSRRASAATAEAAAESAGSAVETPAADNAGEAAQSDEAKADAAEAPAEAAPKKRNSRSRSKKPATDAAASETAAEPTADAEGVEKDAAKGGAENGNGRNGQENRNNRNGESQRSSRTRQRERKRRGQGDDLEPEITEDDVLLPIAGILDVLDNYAFVRTSGYLPGTNDVYVSLGQVKKYGLRKGDSVVGAIRQPRDGEGGGRQKYNAIVRVDTINSRPVDETQERAEFAAFTPLHPTERLRLETGQTEFTQRVVDLFAPVGKGQRGLIVGPRESGKSTALRRIAAAVAANQPDAHLMLVLIDERPEEVTELERTVNGEVIASTFVRTAEDHVTIAERAIERAKRLVELGHDVVVLIDSLTDLARAYNVLAPAATRVPAGHLDATAVY